MAQVFGAKRPRVPPLFALALPLAFPAAAILAFAGTEPALALAPDRLNHEKLEKLWHLIVYHHISIYCII